MSLDLAATRAWIITATGLPDAQVNWERVPTVEDLGPPVVYGVTPPRPNAFPFLSLSVLSTVVKGRDVVLSAEKDGTDATVDIYKQRVTRLQIRSVNRAGVTPTLDTITESLREEIVSPRGIEVAGLQVLDLLNFGLSEVDERGDTGPEISGIMELAVGWAEVANRTVGTIETIDVDGDVGPVGVEFEVEE